VYAFRSSALAAEVAFGGFFEAMSKRDAFRGFLPRIERIVRRWDWHGIERRDAGRRKSEGREAQLRGTLGGIVDGC
jgi:hypothetical protein